MTTQTPIEADVHHALEGTCVLVDLVVGFYLAGQRYALPIDRVQEIQQIVAFSEVPAGSGGVVGMVNLRGEVIPAVDVRILVGLAPQEYSLETPMIIARAGGGLVALLVDEVQDVLSLPADCLQDPPALHTMADRMIGVARMDDGLVNVLDLDRLLPLEAREGGVL